MRDRSLRGREGGGVLTRSSSRAGRALAVLVGAGAAFTALSLLMAVVLGFHVLDAAYAAALLTLLPALSVAQLDVLEGVELERMPAYLSSILALALLTLASGLVGARTGGLAAVGLVALSPGALLGWTVGLLAGGLAMVLAFRALGRALGLSESRHVRALMPRTASERGTFVLLSAAAGIGEELTYRGYLIPLLGSLVGPGAALAITSVAFGVLHAYQGALGMVRAGLLGAILGWGFLVSGSLWPAIVAHALFDLVAGLVAPERLMVPERPEGVEREPEARDARP